MEHVHPPALLVADARALDFLNSIATPVDVPVDWLATGEGLLAWIGQAGLVPDEALQSLRARAEPGELDDVAARARSLREWFRAFVAAHQGRPLEIVDLATLEPLNQLLARDERFGRIVVRPAGAAAGLECVDMRRWHSPETLLLPIAETLAKFICEEDFAQLKACEGARCTLMFVDRTRGHRRRWCSAAICGNRAKVAAHRQRRKEAETH